MELYALQMNVSRAVKQYHLFCPGDQSSRALCPSGFLRRSAGGGFRADNGRFESVLVPLYLLLLFLKTTV